METNLKSSYYLYLQFYFWNYLYCLFLKLRVLTVAATNIKSKFVHREYVTIKASEQEPLPHFLLKEGARGSFNFLSWGSSETRRRLTL